MALCFYNTINAVYTDTPGVKINDKMIDKVTGIWFLERFKFSGLMKCDSTTALGLLQRKDHSLLITHFKNMLYICHGWCVLDKNGKDSNTNYRGRDNLLSKEKIRNLTGMGGKSKQSKQQLY